MLFDDPGSDRWAPGTDDAFQQAMKNARCECNVVASSISSSSSSSRQQAWSGHSHRQLTGDDLLKASVCILGHVG